MLRLKESEELEVGKEHRMQHRRIDVGNNRFVRQPFLLTYSHLFLSLNDVRGIL